MAVSSIKDFWIHPNALTITLNYFGDPQLIQTSMLAGAVIMAYRKDVISYDAAHNFREWKLQAFPTQLNDTCAYYVHAELSRSGDTAMIIYSPVKRDIEGRSFIDGAWDSTTSSSSWFIYLGTISASVDNDGATVERAWTDGFHTGTLDTDQQRMEEASGEWKTMFNYNAVTDQIEPLKPFSKIKVMGEAIFQSIAQFVNGLVIGNRTITDVAASSDSGNESKVSDATLPTTGYVAKEIEALDDHFLIKDGTDPQTVGGDVAFDNDVSVNGNHSVNGNQTIQRNLLVNGNTKLQDLTIGEFIELGDIIQGAHITPTGVGLFAGLKSPWMQIYELIYNRKTAIQGELTLSDGDTVDAVEDIGGRQYRLSLREQYEGYVTSFKYHDIIYANVNLIGKSGEGAKTGKCWMRIDNVEDDGLHLLVTLYNDSQLVSGTTNMGPAPQMIITRHGNETNKDRQDVWVISSEDGRMYMLTGVDSPKIDSESVYAVVVGVLPKVLLDYINEEGYSYVNPNQPYVYVRGLVAQDFIHVDYRGKVIRTENFRGAWNANTATTDPYRDTKTMYDTVSHDGSIWQCNEDKTTSEPKDGDTAWNKIVSKGDDGTSIKIKGEKSSVNELPIPPDDPSDCYIIGQNLYVWLPDEYKWHDAGQFKGDKGDSQYIHIAYANSTDGKDFSTSDPTGRSYIGTYTDTIEKDSEKYSDYTWMYNKGSQGDTGEGISEEIIEYGISDDFVTVPENWSKEEPTNIEQGKVLWVKTTTKYTKDLPDNVTITKTYQGLDNTSVQYELRTNVNIIYIHDRENASKQSINIIVGKTTSKGYVEFIDSDSLREEGFEIQYNYDSQGERKTLEYGQTGIMLEDGSMLISEDGSSMVYEFTVEDITAIQDHIMFYLHEIATDKDWAAREVDVVRDGDGALTVEVDEPIIILPVDAKGEKVLTGFSHKSIYAQVKIGGVLQDVSNFDFSVTDNKGHNNEYYNANRDETNNRFRIRFSVSSEANASDLKCISITATGKNSKGETISATSYIYYQHSRSGMAGPMGVAGPSYYPMGEYDANETYEYTYKKDAAGNDVLDKNGDKIISAIPFVWYDPNQNGEGQYYVLNTESIQGVDPVTGYNDGKKWDVFEKTKFIFTEALMARWAQLAKAVFYGDYMFSVDGVASDGLESDYSQHQKNGATRGLMFSADEKLTGHFIPNLFLDFVSGSAKFGKLSESFINYPDNTDGIYSYKKEIAFDSCHNIAHYPIVGNNANPNVVILPKVENEGFWVEDGSHCTIMHKFSMDYTLQPTNYRNAALVVCADELLFTSSADYGEGTWYDEYKGNGWMVWKGRRVKFVFLAPGSVLKLRSFKDATSDNILWYIENASDFVVMETKINAYGDYKGDSFIEIESSDSVSFESNSPLCPIIGSEQFNWFAPHADNLRTEWRLNANGDVNDPYEGHIPLITHIDL